MNEQLLIAVDENVKSYSMKEKLMNEQLFIAVDENGKSYEFTRKTTGNRTLLILEKEKIADVTRLSVLPHLADAKAGDDGYYVIGRKISMMGDPQILFTEREDTSYTYGQCVMPLVVLKRNDTSLLLRFERNYKVQFCVSVTDNCYSLVPIYNFTGAYDPVYDDIRIEVLTLSSNATLGDFARAERNLRLERNEIRTLKEKCETSEATEYARKYPLIRVRMGWKQSPAPISEQTLENEPDMHVACTFKRVREFADELKRLGVEGAELQLVGWNQSGHDGRFPQLFPVDERLGGEEELKKTIAHIKSLGYRISLHTNLIDAYAIADTFTWNDICLSRDGKPVLGGLYSGGQAYHVCLEKQLKNNRRDLPAVAALNLNGIHFTDVISIVEPDTCFAPNHPCYTKDGVKFAQEIIHETRELMGAFSSEGVMDFTLKDLDYGLYVSFGDGFGQKTYPVIDQYIPFFELIYHGTFLYNPISPTVNYPIKQARDRLIFTLRAGRPSFYLYSKFRTGGMANWMGETDLITDTDEDLRRSASIIAEGAKAYLPFADRQHIYMKEYENLGNGIEAVTYEDGVTIVCNFSKEALDYNGVTIPAEQYVVL